MLLKLYLGYFNLCDFLIYGLKSFIEKVFDHFMYCNNTIKITNYQYGIILKWKLV